MRGSASGVWWKHHPDGPARVAVLEADQPAGAEGDHRALRVPGQECTRQSGQMREVAGEQEVGRLCLEPADPAGRVAIGGQAVGLLGSGVEQLGPDLGGLTGPGPAGVEEPDRADAKMVDRSPGHSPDVLGPSIGERPVGVLALGLGLPVLDKVEAHRGHPRSTDLGHQMGPTGPKHVSAALHLPPVLGQLLVEMEQGAALGAVKGQ